MTLLELQSKLQDVVAEGQVGVPVALRLHVAVTGADLLAACVHVMRLSHALFGSPPERVMVQGDRRRQMSVLVTHASGTTLFASVLGGDVASVALQLIGNHGIANLERAEWTGDLPADTDAEAIRWRDALVESHAAGTAVTISLP